MLQQLKAEVCQANLDLVRHGLVTLTWGNVSGISDDRELVVIKPSGVNTDLDSRRDVDVLVEHRLLDNGSFVDRDVIEKHGVFDDCSRSDLHAG